MLGERLTALDLTRETCEAGPDSPFQHTVKKARRFWIDGTIGQYVTFTYQDINQHAELIEKANAKQN